MFDRRQTDDLQLGAYAEGVRGGANKKVNPTKFEKKEGQINKIKNIYQNYHNAVYKWVKSDEFSRA